MYVYIIVMELNNLEWILYKYVIWACMLSEAKINDVGYNISLRAWTICHIYKSK